MIEFLETSIVDSLISFTKEAGVVQFFADGGYKALIMICLSCFLLYLAIKKQYEPLLLLPIAFGMLLTNLPGSETRDSPGIER